MFKIVTLLAGVFAIDACAVSRALKGADTFLARKGSPAAIKACSSVEPGTFLHKRCVHRYWCNTDKMKRTTDVSVSELDYQHLQEKNGCPLTQMQYLRERECMRLCARARCDSRCGQFCKNVSLESLMFGAQLESSFTRIKRKHTSKREITVEKVELLRDCLKREDKSAQSAETLESLKKVNEKFYSKLIKAVGSLKKELTRLCEAPHLLKRGKMSMEEASKSRQNFDVKRAAQFVFDGAAQDAWRKEDVLPSTAFNRLLGSVMDVEITPLKIRHDMAGRRWNREN